MLGDAALFSHPTGRRPGRPMRVEKRNSIAYRMCLVAAGAFDAAVALCAKYDWDVAAGALIAAEAGASATDHQRAGSASTGRNPARRAWSAPPPRCTR